MTQNFIPFYCGTSGLALQVPKRLFPAAYQSGSRLQYYASIFNSIEVNSSFYKIPMERTIRRWHEEIAGPFTFTFKLWKGITHDKSLQFDPGDVNRFLQNISAAGDMSGCLLLQFPPRLTVDFSAQLEKLAECILENNISANWKIAIEFRNKSWYIAEIFELLSYYNICLVQHDEYRSATPDVHQSTRHRYFRFHGTEPGYRGDYPQEFLAMQAAKIRGLLAAGIEVYTYFNNTVGNALENVTMLRDLVLKEPITS